LLLSFVPVVAGLVRLSGMTSGDQVTPDNARFMATPLPFVLHILGATLFCLVGAFQFDAAMRRRHLHLHRMAGRVLAPCGMLAALTGLWMTASYPIPAALQGDLLHGVRLVVGLAMAVAIALSVQAVLKGRIAQHRAWMIRAYALGQGAGTQVLLMLPVTLIAGAPTFFLRDVLMATAWGLNVFVAEWIVRRRMPTVASVSINSAARHAPDPGADLGKLKRTLR
jgi:uncharacterized membrane protein YozB (DUF420 family)